MALFRWPVARGLRQEASRRGRARRFPITSIKPHGPGLRGVLLALCAGLGMPLALAATPDAGSLLPPPRQERPAPISRPILQLPPAPPAPEESPDGLGVHIIGFVLEGPQLITDEQFSLAVAPFISRLVNYADLRAAAQAVAWAYRQAGWVVSATLPEQDVSDGIVRIAVNPAELGRVEVTGPEVSASRAAAVTRYVTAQQAPAQVLRIDALNRAILLLNELPGVNASGVLIGFKN